MMKKRNPFANKQGSSFLSLVQRITEGYEGDETEGLDFDEDADVEDTSDDINLDDDDVVADDEFESDDDFGSDEETVTLDIPKSLAQQLITALQAVVDSEDDVDFEDADLEGDDFESDDDLEGDDEFEPADDEFEPAEDEEETEEEEEDEEEEAEDIEEAEEDEEVLGSNQSNVAQSTISRNGAPKRSKASTSWNTGKTVKSVFDQTVSHEGEPAGTSRDGAPKRSKFSKNWNNSKTVSSRLQPGKHIMEIGK